ncbi:MAG TPA: ABC transporter substrate-binding protein [Stellaceae bacterium]|jgi:NitT/TauT family transport system substrate-binding protein|nr:ABC transporter substrate-binding protein [Stellaceae bacterium]
MAFRTFLARTLLAASAALAASVVAWPQAQADTPPESKAVRLAITVPSTTYLPIYVAEKEGFFKQEGLDVTVTNFRGGSDLTRAIVAGSIDVGCGAPDSVIAAIQAGQDIKVFYGGFTQTPFEWYAEKSAKTLADLKGKPIGITRFGSSTDALTRMVLTKAGLNPKTDVRITQGGGSSERLAALDAGQIAAGPFEPPFSFIAAERGYNLVAKMSDLMPDYPMQSFFAANAYIKSHPETLKRLLKAFVLAVRFSKQHKDEATQILVAATKIDPAYGARTYDAVIGGFREDGLLASDSGLKAFMALGVSSGAFQKAWPLDAYWVNDFRATYPQWKP